MSQAPARRVVRSSTDRVIGGVAGGLAEHLGVASWIVRVGFVVTALIGGLGLVAYALMWVFLPQQLHPDPTASTGSRPLAGWDITGVLGVLALCLGVLMALSVLGFPVRVSQWAPVLLVGGGVALLWRQSDDAQRASIRARAEAGVQATATMGDRQAWVRVVVGLVLVLGGVVAILGPRVDLLTVAQSLAAGGAVVAGMVLIALPWISGWRRRLQAERVAAIRDQERAAMASRVHDSVLQTLTLIQRRADDPREVSRLARAEERALRSWLYAPAGASGTLAAALAEAAAAAETDYDARVELVTVGDAVVDDRVGALVAATREALVNAAKHAGAPVTVYAEVADEQVEVNVRDRGRGFDPERIPEDRHGVRESIIGRLEAAGGRAMVRSAPSEGTEVRLTLPLAGGHG